MNARRFLVCLGAQRSGTTWLNEQLRQHPDTSFPPRKELRFLDPIYVHDFDEVQRERIKEFRLRLSDALGDSPMRDQDLANDLRWHARYTFVTRQEYDDDWYRSLFDECDPDKLTGDFSPDYSLLPGPGIAHLKSILPDARLIFVLRNPVERTWSGSIYPLRHFPTMSETERREKIRAEAYSKMQWNFSDYRSILERFWRHYDSSSICVLFHDDIASNPLKVLRRTCEHAGLDYDARYFAGIDHKVNVGPEIPRDDQIIRDLQFEYLGLLKWLKERFGDHAEKWYDEAVAAVT